MPNLMKVIHGRLVFGKLRKGQLFSYADSSGKLKLARKMYASKKYAAGEIAMTTDKTVSVFIPYERIC